MALRVKSGFSFDHKGAPVVLRTGQLVADDHPWVRGHEAHFELADAAAVGARAGAVDAVETGTAGPGERRSISRGSKRAGEG